MSNNNVEIQFEKLFQEEFLSPRLVEWLDWVAGKDPKHFVALPMIQRGSVWKPRQIITLWDSLLRGMPIGSLMLSRLHEKDSRGNPVQVRKVGSTQLQDVPQGGGASLIDGQQRTLAIMSGWPQIRAEQGQGRTLWIDLADKPGSETLFRLHVTSNAHPYGYTKAEPNAKLSLSDRRKARETLAPGEQRPWDAHFPIRLDVVIRMFVDAEHNVAQWGESVNRYLTEIRPHRGKTWEDYQADSAKWDAKRALDRFGVALRALFNLKVPLIAIPDHCFAQDVATQEGDDPALAVLFKRIGTGGTALSDADYVYSVVKHHLPQTFQLVESMAMTRGFAQLLGPIDIVMTAVRLVSAELGLTDFESPSKTNFDSLRKDSSFLKTFLAMVDSNRLERALNSLTDALKFKPDDGEKDPGLPMHGFILVSRPVLQVLLRWLMISSQGTAIPVEQYDQRVAKSRDELLRFVMYARLGLPDVQKASTWALAWLKGHSTDANDGFPGKALVDHLIQRSRAENNEIAVPLPSKEVVLGFSLSKPATSEKPLTGWERFELEDQYIGVFQRWWGNSHRYQHPMLLWLQRAYVERLDGNPDEVRSDDEVPYDYDHICPANHWGSWTGITSKDRLIDFLSNEKNRGHFYVGNSIGNVRVWYASQNRADGDATATEKLKLLAGASDASVLLKDSAICEEHAELWRTCSDKGSGISWSAERAHAFQRAVECRVYALYAKYYDELKFETWFPA